MIDIPSGDQIAFVGSSGSGKSTFANLLPRFYDVDSGVIELDGHDIKEYKLKHLRSNIAIVSQDVHLFNDTILNNITYASENRFTTEDVKRAAELANATEFIEKLDDGFDTVIGENGGLLSGGQRQRISIARALLQDAPILILDEATSALDNESEKYIQGALKKLKKGKTVITIAHRLSTIEDANTIYVFNDGKIVERGSHLELLEANGSYKRLYDL